MTDSKPYDQRQKFNFLKKLNFFKLITPLLSIVVTLAAIEGLFALLAPVPHSIERNMYYESDPYTGYRLKPGSVGYFQNSIPAVVNRHGHRDDEVTLAKPPGVFRILVLGDSFTAGANVHQEAAYPQVLERLLADRLRTPVQVVNAGVGGWEPFQYAQYYEFYGRDFEPDLILVGFFVGNDAYDQLQRVEQLPGTVLGRRVSREAARRESTKLMVILYERFHLARLLMRSGPAAIDFTRQSCDQFTEQFLAVQEDRLPTHLQRDAQREALAQNSLFQIGRIQALAAEAGIPLVAALLPDENQINPALQARLIPPEELQRYDFAMPQAMLLELFAARGIPTIDLLPAFLADQRCLYMNDTHWTPEGHTLAAEQIAAALAPWLPE